jgi:IclR family transcriptional regulator, pca regulon regulatory protein
VPADGIRAALLAELDTVHAQGWCLLDRELELELGLMSIAAPVAVKKRDPGWPLLKL